MHPDTLIALEVNGEPLPRDHGFSARLVTPGWVGTYSIKWLKRIKVTHGHCWVNCNTIRYVMMGETWSDGDWGLARGLQITEHPVRSSLTLPWPREQLSPGRHRLHSFARGGEAAIVHLAGSSDNGATLAERLTALALAKLRLGPLRFRLGRRARRTRPDDPCHRCGGKPPAHDPAIQRRRLSLPHDPSPSHLHRLACTSGW